MDERAPNTGAAAGAGSASTAPAAFSVRIPGPPVAQGRPRLTTVGGRARAYDPPKSRMWKRCAATLMREARGTRAPLEGPVQAVVIAVSPCPASSILKRTVTPRRWATKRTGDADNIAKACLDAAQTAGWFHDDCQVVRLIVERWVAAQDEAASVTVKVEALT